MSDREANNRTLRLDEQDLEYLAANHMDADVGRVTAGMIAAGVAEIRHYRAVVAKLREHASATPPGYGATKKAIEMCIALLEGSR